MTEKSFGELTACRLRAICKSVQLQPHIQIEVHLCCSYTPLVLSTGYNELFQLPSLSGWQNAGSERSLRNLQKTFCLKLKLVSASARQFNRKSDKAAKTFKAIGPAPTATRMRTLARAENAQNIKKRLIRANVKSAVRDLAYPTMNYIIGHGASARHVSY